MRDNSTKNIDKSIFRISKDIFLEKSGRWHIAFSPSRYGLPLLLDTLPMNLLEQAIQHEGVLEYFNHDEKTRKIIDVLASSGILYNSTVIPQARSNNHYSIWIHQ